MKKSIVTLALAATLLFAATAIQSERKTMPALQNASAVAETTTNHSTASNPLSVADVEAAYGFVSKIKPVYASVFKPTIRYEYDSSKIKIENHEITPLINDDFETTVTATDGIHRVPFKVVVRSRVWLNKHGTGLTAFENFVASFKARPFDSDKMTFFVGDSFFDTRWFFTDFYTRFSGKNAACLGVGSTMAWQWRWYLQKLYAYQPENVVVHVGTNDLHGGYTPEQTYESLVRIFEECRENMPNTAIYWFTVEPRQTNGTLQSTTNIETLNAKVAAYAKDKEWLNVVDTFTPFKDNVLSGEASLYKDSVHVKNPEGYDEMMKAATDAGLQISENSLYGTANAAQSWKTNKNTPFRQNFEVPETGEYVFETTMRISDWRNRGDHVAFDAFGSFTDRIMLWNSEDDDKFRIQGYADGTNYEWTDRGTATHCVSVSTDVKIALLVTKKGAYLFVNNRLEFVLLNTGASKSFSVYSQSVAATFENCFFASSDSDLYKAYANKADVTEYETSSETQKTFYYDLGTQE